MGIQQKYGFLIIVLYVISSLKATQKMSIQERVVTFVSLHRDTAMP